MRAASIAAHRWCQSALSTSIAAAASAAAAAAAVNTAAARLRPFKAVAGTALPAAAAVPVAASKQCVPTKGCEVRSGNQCYISPDIL
jgi:hypothetical protein